MMLVGFEVVVVVICDDMPTATQRDSKAQSKRAESVTYHLVSPFWR
jgi:hypothetical protein